MDNALLPRKTKLSKVGDTFYCVYNEDVKYKVVSWELTAVIIRVLYIITTVTRPFRIQLLPNPSEYLHEPAQSVEPPDFSTKTSSGPSYWQHGTDPK